MTKVISISNSAYENLSKIKNEKSFSEVINYLVNKETAKGGINNLEKFFGKWEGRDTKKLESEIRALRKTFGENRLKGQQSKNYKAFKKKTGKLFKLNAF